jgi:hypothetical protein
MMSEAQSYELQMQLMHEAILQVLSRGLARTTRFPLNGYRRRIYFEGMALVGSELNLLASAAALLVRTAGRDLEAG